MSDAEALLKKYEGNEITIWLMPLNVKNAEFRALDSRQCTGLREAAELAIEDNDQHYFDIEIHGATESPTEYQFRRVVEFVKANKNPS